MKTRMFAVACLKGLTLAVAVSVSPAVPLWADSPKVAAPPPSTAHVQSAYGHLPLSFEANHGQWDPSVQFVTRGSGHQLFLRPIDAVLAVRTGETKTEGRGGDIHQGQLSSSSSPTSQSVVRMRLEGANPQAEMFGLEKLPGIVNYILGEDPSKWRINIPTYQKVEYKDVYSGIDLVYYGHQGQLEYDFIVAPGADLKQITLAFEGVETIDVDQQGDLVLTAHQISTDTALGDATKLRMHKPVVYQRDAHGHKQLLAGSYVLLASESSSQRPAATAAHPFETAHVAFQVASYDASRSLIIDPVLSWATYLGGSAGDEGIGIAVDQAGQAYVTGYTLSPNFPITVGAFQATLSSGDAFVTKLNATGTALVYSTYLGGSGNDIGCGIAVDQAGQAYVTGITDTPGSGFPGTAGSLIQSSFGGGIRDAFVTKLNVTGTALIYSTYLGGSGEDGGLGIALDQAGQAYVTGTTRTSGSGFPGTAGSLIQSSFGGTGNNGSFVGSGDAFVAKINAAGTALVYATYLGGIGSDEGSGIAVDQASQAYVTGRTTTPGSGFPGTAGSPIQSTYGGGGRDAFVAKINAAGTALVYATYLGGSGNDEGSGIAVDQEGSAYVTGRTETMGSGFPGTAGSLIQSTCACNNDYPDAFVTKINASGTALVYSTYLGGSRRDSGAGIAVDGVGQAYVIGDTTTPASGFPGTAGNLIQSPSDISLNIFVTKLNATGTALVYSAYLGGNGSDVSAGIAVDGASNVYVTGDSDSLNFPGTVGSQIQNAFAGGFQDAFVAKITSNLPFAAFKAKAEIDVRRRRGDKFQLRTSFTLNPSNNGLNPLTEAVTVQVGPFATTIPAGSFKMKNGRYRFEGVINGVKLEAVLRSLILGHDYEFTLEGKGAEFSGMENPVTVSLTIGDDSGNETITAIIE
ncbi:MAG: SBBP repeat-containing protein [Nitrospirota bacterium]|nr:SBBP repeat-containing protein [Nitrospirota bacterium]